MMQNYFHRFGLNVTTELTFMCKIDQVPLGTLNQELSTFTICKLSATLNQHAAQNGRMWCVPLKVTLFDIIIRYRHLLFITIQLRLDKLPQKWTLGINFSVSFFSVFNMGQSKNPKDTSLKMVSVILGH